MSVSQTVASDEQTRARYSSVLFIIMWVVDDVISGTGKLIH